MGIFKSRSRKHIQDYLFFGSKSFKDMVSRSKGREKESCEGGIENMFLEMKNELHGVLN